jgi:hypothetical protein
MYIPSRRRRGLGQDDGTIPCLSGSGPLQEGQQYCAGAFSSMPPGQCVSTITGLSVPCPSPGTVSTTPPSQVVGGTLGFWFQQNSGLVWGGVALVGGLLLLKAFTR